MVTGRTSLWSKTKLMGVCERFYWAVKIAFKGEWIWLWGFSLGFIPQVCVRDILFMAFPMKKQIEIRWINFFIPPHYPLHCFIKILLIHSKYYIPNTNSKKSYPPTVNSSQSIYLKMNRLINVKKIVYWTFM